jgi:CheY-like chemotaxis protein
MSAQPPARQLASDAMSTTDSQLDAFTSQFDAQQAVEPSIHDVASGATPSASATQRAVHRAAVAATGSGAGRPVLVVDGSAIARKFLSHKLQAIGYDVHVASDGEQALEMVGQQDFAIIFLEIALSADAGLDGLRLCRAIKQKPDHRRGMAPPVVMVTGLSGSADRVRGSLAGCDAYLTKPLFNEELLATLALVDPLFK